MKIFRTFLFAAAALLSFAVAAPALAQTATVHGHVINAAGFPFSDATVEFTTRKDATPTPKDITNTAPTDANGNYSVSGIKPGDYYVYVVQGPKFIDRLEINLAAGDNKNLDFDMTRAEFQKNLTPEEKKQIEEYKQEHQQVSAENNVIKNLNATLTTVRADLKTASPNYDKDVADMKAGIAAKPDAAILYLTLGDAQTAAADHGAAADRSQGKPVASDDAVMQQYADAVTAYKKGIDLEQASKTPNVANQAAAYNQMGSAFAKEGKLSDAQAAYESAAKLQPASAGMYYFNEAAVFFNASQTNPDLNQPALEAANKAIAADPTKADPYYIKGQILLQKATLDPKTQTLVAPPGCVESYQKYLELDPDGKFASSVEAVLQGLGQKVQTHYSARHHS